MARRGLWCLSSVRMTTNAGNKNIYIGCIDIVDIILRIVNMRLAYPAAMTRLLTGFLILTALCLGTVQRAEAVEFKPIGGQVMFGSTPLCALALANGQSTFTCSGDGRFALNVPLDGNGMVTLQVFVSGFAPFRQTLAPAQLGNFTVEMVRSDSERQPTVTTSVRTSKPGRSLISGTISEGSTPICALVLANGQNMFSCNANLGSFSLDVPLDSKSEITLQIFVAGFQPFRTTMAGNQTPGGGTTSMPLNDTGITWGGNYSEGNNTTCIGETVGEQDCSHGRDATHNNDDDGRAGFSFTKIDSNGDALSVDATAWSCVQDNTTGLIWEVKTNKSTLQRDFRDMDYRYTWYNSTGINDGGAAGTPNGGSCHDAINCDTEKYVMAVNAAGLCGGTDWRIPTVSELAGLLDLNILTLFEPLIDTVYFPNTDASSYWTSTPVAADSNRAWVIGFTNSYAYDNDKPRDNSYRVRLVRGP